MATFKGLIKACEVCQAEFKVPQSQAHVRTCSTICGYQIRHSANKKERVEMKCGHCKGLFTEYPSHASRRKFCSVICGMSDPATLARKSAAMSGTNNPGWDGGVTVYATSESGKHYRRGRPHLENEKSTRRSRVKAGATPAWGSLEKVKAIYALSQKMTAELNVMHHVDHQVPLTSKLVCGLHNEFNLKILPSTENLKKHNRTWPDMW